MASEGREGNGREKDGSAEGEYCFMLSGGIDATVQDFCVSKKTLLYENGYI
jgi:hypothetical protein